MTKEIMLSWRLENRKPSLAVQYILHGEKASISFTIRCPTEDLHYWLPTGIDYHADEPQYEGHTKMEKCTLRKNNYCYCDGTSLGAEELFENFIANNLDVNIIWDNLEEWMKYRFI